MLILIFIEVQYSQNAVFSFEKGLNCQNHFSSGSHHLVQKFHQQNFQFPLLGRGDLPPTPTPYPIWKTLLMDV